MKCTLWAAATPGGGKSLKQTAGGRPLEPWAVHAALWGHCGASAGVFLAPCPFCDVEQGPPHDGVGAVEERLVVGRDMSITLDEQCRCTGLSGCGVVVFSLVRANTSSVLWSVHNWKGSVLEAGADGFDTCNDGVQFPV